MTQTSPSDLCVAVVRSLQLLQPIYLHLANGASFGAQTKCAKERYVKTNVKIINTKHK